MKKRGSLGFEAFYKRKTGGILLLQNPPNISARQPGDSPTCKTLLRLIAREDYT